MVKHCLAILLAILFSYTLQAQSYTDSLSASSKVEMKEQYDFTGDFQLNIFSTDKEGNKRLDGHFRYYYHQKFKDRLGIRPLGLKPEESVFTILENGNMITLDAKTKTAILLSYEQFEKELENQATSSAKKELSASFAKTGNKKSINGFQCEEYLAEDSESRTIAWFTNEISFDITSVFHSLGMDLNMPANFPKGLMMILIHYDKRRNTFSEMNVSDVNPQKKTTIETKGYKPMSFSELMKESEGN